MWEITLIGNKENYVEINDFLSILNDIFDKDIITAICYGDNVICSIATNRDEIIKFLQDVVYELIIKISKKDFFSTALTNINSDELKMFIVSSIISIDLAGELEFAKKTTKLGKIININSFMHFKLGGIISNWKKVADYLNFKYYCCLEDELYLHLLKFIVDNASSFFDIVYLEEDRENVVILDKDRNKIKTIGKKDEIGIIASLIMYSPQKLIINCMNSFSDKVTNLITYIFNEKVSTIL
ncbi:MAG: hypothetical protein E7345_00585 [Clostridiales bacterium]|nr:hypothetical protein [Clostridiales bacterium]